MLNLFWLVARLQPGAVHTGRRVDHPSQSSAGGAGAGGTEGGPAGPTQTAVGEAKAAGERRKQMACLPPLASLGSPLVLLQVGITA